ncbi:MAG: hypothetical protein RL621_2 [Bacteroidota bacterium]|jgi:hypothetical protein
MFKTAKTTTITKAITKSNKKKFSLHSVKAGRELDTGSYWDSGSKDNHIILNYRTGVSFIPFAGNYPTFKASHSLQPGEIMITTGFTQGKESTPLITFQENEETEVMNHLGNPQIIQQF